MPGSSRCVLASRPATIWPASASSPASSVIRPVLPARISSSRRPPGSGGWPSPHEPSQLADEYRAVGAAGEPTSAAIPPPHNPPAPPPPPAHPPPPPPPPTR